MDLGLDPPRWSLLILPGRIIGAGFGLFGWTGELATAREST
jgi:hypothetical protein